MFFQITNFLPLEKFGVSLENQNQFFPSLDLLSALTYVHELCYNLRVHENLHSSPITKMKSTADSLEKKNLK